MSSVGIWKELLSNLGAFSIDLAHHFKCRAAFLGPRHAHHNVWQGSFILSGRCEIEVDGTRSAVGPDDFVFIFPEEYHESFDTDDDEYELFDIKFSAIEGIDRKFVPNIPTVINVRNTAGIISSLERLSRSKALGKSTTSLIYLVELLMLLTEESVRTEQAVSVQTDMDLSIEQAVEYISLHYHEQITIDELASLVHVSPSHFAATFKETTGVSPIELLIRTRISRAKEFLEFTNFPTKRIAAECGFNSTQYFARLFCQRVGLSPKQYRSTVHRSYIGAANSSGEE